jgi:hypothetical protein
MSTESPPEWPAVDPPPFIPAPRRRWPIVLLMMVVMALAGAGASYAWLTPGLFSQAADREAGEADAGANDKAVMTDLLAAAQKTSDDLAAIDRTIASQQEQLKAIVNQLAELSSKIDALKSPVPQAPVAPSRLPPPPVAMPSAAVPPVAPAPVARVAPKPKKPPRELTPTGPISVGGAPLNVTPDATVR